MPHFGDIAIIFPWQAWQEFTAKVVICSASNDCLGQYHARAIATRVRQNIRTILGVEAVEIGCK
jgi:hypothetical protein